VAREAGIEVEGHRIAQDAAVVIVPAANRVRQLTVAELQSIWSGEVTDWSAFGGSGRIVPVMPPLSGDLARAFVQRVLEGAPVKAACALEASDTAVVQRVAKLPGGIGIVPLRMSNSPGVRALALSAVAGMDYIEPDMQTVHEGRYPITLFVNLFRRTRGPRLAGGFLTHVASEPGQRVVLQHGRVPTGVPLRFVRRSPLLGSH
jgi:phosphate transport system substrate-binding protein